MDMKRIAVTLTVLFIICSSVNAQNRYDFSLRLGLDVARTVNGNNGEKYSSTPGIPTVNIEGHFFPFEKHKLGIGLGFAYHYLNTKDTDMGWLWTYPNPEIGKLFWWPLYLSLRYNFTEKEKISIYLRLDNGYNIFAITNNIMLPDDRNADANSWGGYYFSTGLGVVFAKKVTIDLSYSSLSSGIGTDYQYNGYWLYWDENFKTNTITLSIGYTL